MKKSIALIVVVAILGLGVLIVFNDKDDKSLNGNEITINDESEMKEEVAKSAESTADGMMRNDGEMATSFDLKDLNGNMVSLSEFNGQKVYVKFWASWCSICLAGLEELDAVAAEEHDYEIITIVSPSYKGEKNTEKFMAWFEKQDLENLTVLLDEDGDIAREYGIRGYPTSVFIGSDGTLVNMFTGHLENDVITEQFMDIK